LFRAYAENAQQVTRHWWEARVEFDGFKSHLGDNFQRKRILDRFHPGIKEDDLFVAGIFAT
jgi:hypothetical protein